MFTQPGSGKQAPLQYNRHMNRANPVYLTYRLSDRSLFVACWNWQRLFFANAQPEAWEQVPAGKPSALEQRCKARGYRLMNVLEPRKKEVWEQLQASHAAPRRTRKQQRKAQEREQRKQEAAAERALWLQKLGEAYAGFQTQFSGLSEADIRKTYRRLAREHHPDLGGESDRFQALNQAYREALARV